MLKHSLLVSCNLVSTPFLNAMAASHSLLFSPPFFCFLHLPPQGSQSDAVGWTVCIQTALILMHVTWKCVFVRLS